MDCSNEAMELNTLQKNTERTFQVMGPKTQKPLRPKAFSVWNINDPKQHRPPIFEDKDLEKLKELQRKPLAQQAETEEADGFLGLKISQGIIS